MDHATKGAKALAASDATTAIVEYTQALIEHPTSPDYFTQRSTAFSRIKPPRHDLALVDAEYGVLAAQKRGKRDKMQAAQQRRVVCLYNTGKYADAKLVLDSMLKWRPANNKAQKMEHDMWTSKIDMKLKSLAEPQTVTVKEMPDVSLPEEKVMRKTLQKQLKKDGTFNYDGTEEVEDTHMKDVESSRNTPSASTVAPTSTNTSSTTPTASTPQKIRHEWFQSPTTVTLTLYAKNVPKDKAEIEINSDSIHVSFPHPSDPSSTFDFSLDPLFALIDTAKSKGTVMGTKIELILAKAVTGQKWANIEGTTPLVKTAITKDSAASNGNVAQTVAPSTTQQPSTTNTAPSYPTSSKSGPKNWDKLANDLTKKPTKPKDQKTEKSKADDSDSDNPPEDLDEDEYGGDAVDGFFKKLYKGSDPDTQRAMMKSFYESNGTTLSTNWNEVGKGFVKPYDKRKKEEEGED